jgi:DNA-binding PadR family transcriptional regulator
MDTPDESKSQDRSLTATSYGVLSILALRDHSTYDITRQMRISLHYLWPRAESNVYAEPKRLVAAGLAAAREEWTGSRRRTVYSITDAGRAALARWLSEPSSRARYESEALMKLLFAENGTTADMLAAIKAVREDATNVVTHFLGIADRYAAGAGEYPQRFALSGLAARLLIEQAVAAIRWAAWAERSIAGWTTPTAEDAEWGIAALRTAAQAVESR